MTELAAALSLWCVSAVMAVLVLALLYRRIAHWQLGVAPESRASQQLLLAALPVLLACWVTALALRPEWAFALVPAHCHGSLCAPHGPVFSLSSLGAAALTASVVLLLFALVLLLATVLVRNRRQRRLLEWLSSTSGSGYRVIDSEHHQAWCAGVLRPQPYVSRGLLERLDEKQLHAVLAHEQAHVLRRDNLRRLLLNSLTLLWPRQVRKRLVEDFYLSTEQACDRSALAVVGSDTLLEALALVDGDATRERAEALCRDYSPQRAVQSWLLLAGLALALALSLGALSHPLVEWLLQGLLTLN